MRGRRLVLLLYLFSGAAALVYEVVWLRLLTLTMGHTAGAVGTVLAAFMGGLAIGAALAGRMATSLSRDRALRMYAWLELAIALCALLVPLALSAAHPALTWAYQDGEGGRLFGLTRVLLSLLLLSIPAAAMGATYPIAVQWSAEPGPGTAAWASGLYAANTVGAALGAALSGFVLIPVLGLQATTFSGMGLNAAAAFGALWLARRASTIGPVAIDPEVESRPPVPRAHRDARIRRRSSRPARIRAGDRTGAGPDRERSSPWRLRVAAGALAVSGFVALVYEVTWTRVLALLLGPTTYAFAAMLVAFIAGIAIGSTLAAARLDRTRQPGAWLGLALIAAAAAALAICWHVDRLTLSIAAAVARPDARFASMLAFQIALAVALLLPMAIAFGAAFPFAIALAASGTDRAPREAATVYALNTAGAIAGALAASFLLIPLLGLQTTVRAAGLLAIAAGATVSWVSATPGARLVAAIAASVAAAVAVVMPPWNRALLSSGAYYQYGSYMAGSDVEAGLEAGRLLFYEEGATGTISVKRLAGVVSLAIDGKVDASNGSDMLTQKLLAHLPLLLHPRPRSVCVIGLGSGVTLGSALRHPIERADVVEISPEVVAASEHFATENGNALGDRRTRLIVGDGRSHLLLSRDRYDVIISEPSNPWLAGVATLFTREFFQAARQRLAPGGILTQWAHTYRISDSDLRSIVATFLSVFPDGTAWLVGEGDLLLIGSTGPFLTLDHGVSDAWARPGVAADLADVAVRDPFSLLSLFVARGPALRQYAGTSPVQSDDLLLLEYSAPRAILGRFQSSNVAALRDLAGRSEPPPAVARALAEATPVLLRNRGLMQLKAHAYGLAYEDLRLAVADAPQDAAALDGLARAAAGARQLDETAAFLTTLAATTRSVPALLELSTILASRGRIDEAMEAARQAASIEPGHLPTLEQLASLFADRGDEPALESVLQAMERHAPDRPAALYFRANLHYLRGDFAGAATLAERLVTIDRADARAFNLLGAAYTSLGQNDRARQAFEASVRANPLDAAVLVNLGTIELRSADPVAAASRFAEALFLSPALRPALSGLADALEQQGQAARAAKIRSQLPAS